MNILKIIKLLSIAGGLMAFAQASNAASIAETLDPKPTAANKCANISQVPNGIMPFHDFTFGYGINVRNLDVSELIHIQNSGIRIPSTGTRIDVSENASLIWLKFLQVSSGDVYISAFIDTLYTEISPGGVDGKTYLITGNAIRGFSLRSDINEPRLVEICYVAS